MVSNISGEITMDLKMDVGLMDVVIMWLREDILQR